MQGHCPHAGQLLRAVGWKVLGSLLGRAQRPTGVDILPLCSQGGGPYGHFPGLTNVIFGSLTSTFRHQESYLSWAIKENNRSPCWCGSVGWSVVPVHWKAVGSIPGHGTYLGCGFDSWSERVWETTNWCFSLIWCFSFSRINKKTSLGEDLRKERE